MEAWFAPPPDAQPEEVLVEGRGTWLYAAVVVGGSGFFLVVLSLSLVFEASPPPVLWVCWAISLVLVLLAIAEALLYRVAITRTTITVRHLWTQRVALAELRSIHRRLGDIVVKPARGTWLLLPTAVTNRDKLVDQIARTIAANLAAEARGVNGETARRVREGLDVPR